MRAIKSETMTPCWGHHMQRLCVTAKQRIMRDCGCGQKAASRCGKGCQDTDPGEIQALADGRPEVPAQTTRRTGALPHTCDTEDGGGAGV